MKQNEVLQILKANKQEILDQFPIASLSVFGSVARDEARPESDVDILVSFSQPVGLFRFIALQQHLEGLLGCKVDLSTPRSLQPGMKDEIMQELVNVT